ncbi:hypothetical protein PybrP1_004080 [[Pythium] brassicae (nom. inval.)]|nr:hypothetical protein PybrP1_004080 [[Pythium] brassicae (nom. inval.)]
MKAFMCRRRQRQREMRKCLLALKLNVAQLKAATRKITRRVALEISRKRYFRRCKLVYFRKVFGPHPATSLNLGVARASWRRWTLFHTYNLVFRVWRRELVLSEAKQVLGGLSFYHPHQQLYTRIVKEKAQSLRATANAERCKAEMKKKRRMLDPQATRTKQLVESVAGRSKDSDTESEGISASHRRVCFRMLRDLGLFHNQFYLHQMERAMGQISLDRIALARERVRVAEGDDERRYLQQLEADYLKHFLDNAIRRHPLFDTRALKPETRAPATSSSPLFEKLTVQWLVSVYLLAKSELRPRTEKPFWINSALPNEVEAALGKLMLCINKYFKVLAQLFLAPLSTSQRQQQRSNRQHLAKPEFMKLLQLMHVFPQLLTRRELENAFDAACCARPDQKEINFPEFVEALVRCSSTLQWGNSHAGANETGVVVRFLMLLFAMEGKGTVLQKRSEDLHVVIGFLEQQQAQTKAAKLQRFCSLLDQEKRERATKNDIIRQQESVPTVAQLNPELLDGDAFVREILSSIGDVELLLQHSSVPVRPALPQQKTKSVDEYSDDFELESADDLPSCVVRSLFASGNSLVMMEIGTRDGDELLVDQFEDVPVNDPMLNQLTDIERFTDSDASCSCEAMSHERE